MNDQLIINRIEKFLGYGNLKSDIWLIGIEEGFKGDENIDKRLEYSYNKEVIDILEMKTSDHLQWFIQNAHIQATYKYLIRTLLLKFENKSNPDKEYVRNYQINRLGRLSGNHALLELLPLPNKSKNSWEWDKLSTLPELQTREAYTRIITPKRIELINKKIRIFQPAIVIYYCGFFPYKPYLEQIYGTLKEIKDPTFGNEIILHTKYMSTNIFLTRFPLYSGRGIWDCMSKKMIEISNKKSG